MGKRLGITKVELKAKLLGADKWHTYAAGSRCHAERIGATGEFMLWFTGKYYHKVDAVRLHDVVKYADDRPGDF